MGFCEQDYHKQLHSFWCKLHYTEVHVLICYLITREVLVLKWTLDLFDISLCCIYVIITLFLE